MSPPAMTMSAPPPPTLPGAHMFQTKSSLAVPGIMMGTSNAPGYSQTKKLPTGENTGRWTKEEHARFLEGLELHGKEWKKISHMIDSRTVVQIRTHAQKYFQKLAKSAEQQGHEVPGDLMSTARNARASADGSASSSSQRRRSVSGAGSRRNGKRVVGGAQSVAAGTPMPAGLPFASPASRGTTMPPKPRAPAPALSSAPAQRSTKSARRVRKGKQDQLQLQRTSTLSRQNSVSSCMSSNSAAFSFDGVGPEVSLPGTPHGHAASLSPTHHSLHNGVHHGHHHHLARESPLESPRNAGAIPSVGAGRLTIAPELTYNLPDSFPHVYDEDNLKWFEHLSSGRLPDASPTGVADLDFSSGAEDIGALFAPSPVSVTSSRRGPLTASPSTSAGAAADHDAADEPHTPLDLLHAPHGASAAAQVSPVSTSAAGAQQDASDDDFAALVDSDDFDHISETLMTTDEASGDHDRDCDMLSSVDGAEPHDQDLEPQPDLSGSGPFTDYVFGSANADDPDDFLDVSTSSNTSSPCSSLEPTLELTQDTKRRRLSL